MSEPGLDEVGVVILVWLFGGAVAGLFVGCVWDHRKLRYPEIVGVAAGLLVPLTVVAVAALGVGIALCEVGRALRHRSAPLPRAEVRR